MKKVMPSSSKVVTYLAILQFLCERLQKGEMHIKRVEWRLKRAQTVQRNDNLFMFLYTA